VIIDGPPRVTELARSAILASDLIIIPVQPSPYDIWSAKEITALVNEAAIFKDALRSAFVINRKIVNTAIGRDVNEALAGFAGTPVLRTAIAQRVAFAETAARGLTVIEAEPSGAAAREIEALTDDLEEFMA
jgi:chromosome partitioning protein